MTKLERARRFLKEAARPGLRVLSIALLAASAYAGTVAPVGTVFNVSGAFDDGDSLSGTIDIDTTGSGGILSADLTVDPFAVTYTFTTLTSGSFHSFLTASSSTSYDYQASFSGSDGSTLSLDILTGTNTFDGFTGGSLCSDATACGGAETNYNDPFNLGSGLLIEAVPTGSPEPSTVLLTITGGSAVLALRRRKRRT